MGFTSKPVTANVSPINDVKKAFAVSAFFGFWVFSAVRILPSCVLNSPMTLNSDLASNSLISRSRSTTNLTATDCTRPADNLGCTLRHKIGDNSKPTNRSNTRRACCASTKHLSMVLGFSIACKIAVFVISLKTMRLVFSSLRPNTSNKCQLMASPSLSSSDANQTVSASLAYFFNSATNFFFSSGTSYLGKNPFLTSMAESPDDKSRM